MYKRKNEEKSQVISTQGESICSRINEVSIKAIYKGCFTVTREPIKFRVSSFWQMCLINTCVQMAEVVYTTFHHRNFFITVLSFVVFGCQQSLFSTGLNFKNLKIPKQKDKNSKTKKK